MNYILDSHSTNVHLNVTNLSITYNLISANKFGHIEQKIILWLISHTIV